MTKTVHPSTLRADTPYSDSDRPFGGISFLHTAPGHVATFGALMTDLAPEIPVRHEVARSDLATARHRGALTPDLAEHAYTAFDHLAERGARVLVCTCATLGPCAERYGEQNPDILVQRIDHAAAEHAYFAACEGSGVVNVAACLASTFAPTLALFAALESRVRAGITVRPLLLPEPWSLFQDGLRRDFRHSIADAITLMVPAGGVILLNQPSMAGAAPLLPADRYHVVSSPLPGVRAAIQAWRQLAAADARG